VGGMEFAGAGSQFGAHAFRTMDPGPAFTFESVWADGAFDLTMAHYVWSDLGDRHPVTGALLFDHVAIL